MDFWSVLFDVGVLLAVAFVLGALCERLRQSALLGYLLAGMLLGPNTLNVVESSRAVEGLAEVGVSLLLFSLGLEFSWNRLASLGWRAVGSGALQVGLTMGAIAGLAWALGLNPRTALVLGAALALSSTAVVLRVLMGRGEADSLHGRHALGILLFQDLAVVPLVLVVGFLTTPELGSTALVELGRTGISLFLMAAVFYVVFNHVVPRTLLAAARLRNRELPVLFAVVGAFGAIFVAHELGLSPAVGAFIAGMLLGDSPFATQVRADLSVLRTLLVTVFFSSIGMLADPAWILEHLGVTLAVVAVVLAVKTLVCFLALRVMGQTSRSSLAAALCLSQVGEFAFVIAVGARGSLVDDEMFLVIVSTMMLTLLVTPYAIAWGPRISAWLLRPLERLGISRSMTEEVRLRAAERADHVILIGYGPAGQSCGRILKETERDVLVLDLNPWLAARAREDGFEGHVGDASHPEVLEHLQVSSACAVVIALPDPRAVGEVAFAVRSQSDGVPLVVRARYHLYREDLVPSGESAVVDEEELVGLSLGERAQEMLKEPD